MRNLLLALICALPLVGCDDDTPPQPAEAKVYASVEACKVDLPEAECQKAFDAAQAEHVKTAPHFQDPARCEDVYGPGNCVPRVASNGDPFYMPFMMGYMLGRDTSGPTVVYHQYPVYVDRHGGAWSRGSSVGTFTRATPSAPTVATRGGFGGSASVAPAGLGSVSGKVAITPSAVSRGGFGGMASSFASSAGG